MGYCKVIQYANITEIYTYQNDITKKRKVHRERSKRKAGAVFFRSGASIKRAKSSFYRNVAAQLHAKGAPAFITFTYFEDNPETIKNGYKQIRQFFSIIAKHIARASYIVVPEWQKRGQLHFHALVWGLPRQYTEKSSERNSRILQRFWALGYVDVLNATNNSTAISRYLTKYMVKAYSDSRIGNRRAYTRSNDFPKVYVYGSNTLSTHLPNILTTNHIQTYETVYDVPYIGQCNKSIYENNN